jgi:hypothetical protein
MPHHENSSLHCWMDFKFCWGHFLPSGSLQSEKGLEWTNSLSVPSPVLPSSDLFWLSMAPGLVAFKWEPRNSLAPLCRVPLFQEQMDVLNCWWGLMRIDMRCWGFLCNFLGALLSISVTEDLIEVPWRQGVVPLTAPASAVSGSYRMVGEELLPCWDLKILTSITYFLPI